MIKKYLPTILLTSALILAPMLFGLIVWGRLPDPMPSHFGASGEVNGYLPKAAAVFGLPLGMLLLQVVCAAITLIDPKRENIDGKPFRLVLWIIPVVSALANGLTYAYALGLAVNVSAVVVAGLGVLFIALGNYLPKCGLNYSIGIRTPWALNDEDNWRATHRFGGKVYVLGGVLTLLLSFFTMASSAALRVIFPVILAVAAAPGVYSYVYHRKHPKREE